MLSNLFVAGALSREQSFVLKSLVLQSLADALGRVCPVVPNETTSKKSNDYVVIGSRSIAFL